MYNKFQYHKLNDRKTLKKVKKQWVITSVALLDVVGVDGTYPDKSMETTSDSNHSDGYTANQAQRSADGSPASNNTSPSVAASQAGFPDPTTSSSQVSSVTVSSKSNDNGDSDFSNGFSAASSAVAAGQVVQYGRSNYNAGIDAYYAANAGAVAAWNAFHPNDVKYADSTASYTADNVYYQSAFRATQSAFNTYQNLNQGAGTQNDYQNGSGNQTVDRDHPAQVLSSPRDQNYSSTDQPVFMDEQALVLPDDWDQVTPDQKIAYNYAVEYFLSRQGAYDAEVGKWNGCDGTGDYTVFSEDEQLRTANNPYTRAYLGAQSALKNEWNKRDFQIVDDNSDPTDYFFNYGYTDVQDKVNHQGIVFITDSDGFQLNHAFATVPRNSDYILRLTTDINYTGGSVPNTAINGSDINMVLDGQNHIADLWTMNNYPKQVANLKVQNFRKLYGSSSYGPVNLHLAKTGTMTYKNVNYEGSRFFINDQLPQLNIQGTVNVISRSHYTSPFGTKDSADGEAQPNVLVKNMELATNAHFNSIAENGNNVEVIGTLKLSENATMHLTPYGREMISDDHIDETKDHGNRGLVLLGEDANLVLNSHSQLVITPGNDLASALIVNSNCNVDINGGTLKVEISTDPRDNHPVRIIGNVLVRQNGNFIVHGTTNVVEYGGNLVTLEGSLNVNNRGNLAIYTDGNTINDDFTLLGGFGNLKIDNPGHHVLFSKNGLHNDQSGEGSGKFFRQLPITAYEVSAQIDDQVDQRPQNMMGIGIKNTPLNVVSVLRPDGSMLERDSDLPVFNNQTSQYLAFNAVPSVYFAEQIRLVANLHAQSGYSMVAELRVNNLDKLADSDDGHVYIRVVTNTHDELAKYNNDLIYKPQQATGSRNDGDYRNGYTASIPVADFSPLEDGEYSYHFVCSLNAVNGTPTAVSVDVQLGVTNQSSSISNNDNGDTYYNNISHNPARGPITNVRGVIKGKITDNIIVPDNTAEDSSLASVSGSLAMKVASSVSGYANGFTSANGDVAVPGAISYAQKTSYACGNVIQKSNSVQDMSAEIENNRSAHSNQIFSSATAILHNASNVMVSLNSFAIDQNLKAKRAAKISQSCAEISRLQAISASSEAAEAKVAQSKFASLSINYFVNDKSQLEQTASGEANSAATAAGSYENNIEMSAAIASSHHAIASKAASLASEAEKSAIAQWQSVGSIYNQIIDPSKTASSADVAASTAAMGFDQLVGAEGIRNTSQQIDLASLDISIITNIISRAETDLDSASFVFDEIQSKHSDETLVQRAAQVILSASDTISNAMNHASVANSVVSDAKSAASFADHLVSLLVGEARSAAVDAHNENVAVRSAVTANNRQVANEAATAASEAAFVATSANATASSATLVAEIDLDDVSSNVDLLVDDKDDADEARHAIDYVLATVEDEFTNSDPDAILTTLHSKANHQIQMMSDFTSIAMSDYQVASSASDGVVSNVYVVSGYSNLVDSFAQSHSTADNFTSASSTIKNAHHQVSLFALDERDANYDLSEASSLIQSTYRSAEQNVNKTSAALTTNDEQTQLSLARSTATVMNRAFETASMTAVEAKDAKRRAITASTNVSLSVRRASIANVAVNKAINSLFDDDAIDGVKSATAVAQQALSDVKKTFSGIDSNSVRASKVASVASGLATDHTENDRLQSAARIVVSAKQKVSSVVDGSRNIITTAKGAVQEAINAESLANTASINISFYSSLASNAAETNQEKAISASSSVNSINLVAKSAFSTALSASRLANSVNVLARTNSGIARAATNSAVSANEVVVSLANNDQNGLQVVRKANQDTDVAMSNVTSGTVKVENSCAVINQAMSSAANFYLLASQAASNGSEMSSLHIDNVLIKRTASEALKATSVTEMATKQISSAVSLANSYGDIVNKLGQKIKSYQEIKDSTYSAASSTAAEHNVAATNSLASLARSTATLAVNDNETVNSVAEKVDILDSQAKTNSIIAKSAATVAISAAEMASKAVNSTPLQTAVSQTNVNFDRIGNIVSSAADNVKKAKSAADLANRASNGLNVNSSKASSAASAAVSLADARFGNQKIALAANDAKSADNGVRKAAIEEYAANDDVKMAQRSTADYLDKLNTNYQIVESAAQVVNSAAAENEVSVAISGASVAEQATQEAINDAESVHKLLYAASSAVNNALGTSAVAKSNAELAMSARVTITSIVNDDHGSKAVSFAMRMVNQAKSSVEEMSQETAAFSYSARHSYSEASEVNINASQTFSQTIQIASEHAGNWLISSTASDAKSAITEISHNMGNGSLVLSVASVAKIKTSSAAGTLNDFNEQVSKAVIKVDQALSDDDKSFAAKHADSATQLASKATVVVSLANSVSSDASIANQQMGSLASNVASVNETLIKINALAISLGVNENVSIVTSASAAVKVAASGTEKTIDDANSRGSLIASLKAEYQDNSLIASQNSFAVEINQSLKQTHKIINNALNDADAESLIAQSLESRVASESSLTNFTDQNGNSVSAQSAAQMVKLANSRAQSASNVAAKSLAQIMSAQSFAQSVAKEANADNQVASAMKAVEGVGSYVDSASIAFEDAQIASHGIDNDYDKASLAVFGANVIAKHHQNSSLISNANSLAISANQIVQSVTADASNATSKAQTANETVISLATEASSNAELANSARNLNKQYAQTSDESAADEQNERVNSATLNVLNAVKSASQATQLAISAGHQARLSSSVASSAARTADSANDAVKNAVDAEGKNYSATSAVRTANSLYASVGNTYSGVKAIASSVASHADGVDELQNSLVRQSKAFKHNLVVKSVVTMVSSNNAIIKSANSEMDEVVGLARDTYHDASAANSRVANVSEVVDYNNELTNSASFKGDLVAANAASSAIEDAISSAADETKIVSSAAKVITVATTKANSIAGVTASVNRDVQSAYQQVDANIKRLSQADRDNAAAISALSNVKKIVASTATTLKSASAKFNGVESASENIDDTVDTMRELDSDNAHTQLLQPLISAAVSASDDFTSKLFAMNSAHGVISGAYDFNNKQASEASRHVTLTTSAYSIAYSYANQNQMALASSMFDQVHQSASATVDIVKSAAEASKGARSAYQEILSNSTAITKATSLVQKASQSAQVILHASDQFKSANSRIAEVAVHTSQHVESITSVATGIEKVLNSIASAQSMATSVTDNIDVVVDRYSDNSALSSVSQIILNDQAVIGFLAKHATSLGTDVKNSVSAVNSANEATIATSSVVASGFGQTSLSTVADVERLTKVASNVISNGAKINSLASFTTKALNNASLAASVISSDAASVSKTEKEVMSASELTSTVVNNDSQAEDLKQTLSSYANINDSLNGKLVQARNSADQDVTDVKSASQATSEAAISIDQLIQKRQSNAIIKHAGEMVVSANNVIKSAMAVINDDLDKTGAANLTASNALSNGNHLGSIADSYDAVNVSAINNGEMKSAVSAITAINSIADQMAMTTSSVTSATEIMTSTVDHIASLSRKVSSAASVTDEATKTAQSAFADEDQINAIFKAVNNATDEIKNNYAATSDENDTVTSLYSNVKSSNQVANQAMDAITIVKKQNSGALIDKLTTAADSASKIEQSAFRDATSISAGVSQAADSALKASQDAQNADSAISVYNQAASSAVEVADSAAIKSVNEGIKDVQHRLSRVSKVASSTAAFTTTGTSSVTSVAEIVSAQTQKITQYQSNVSLVAKNNKSITQAKRDISDVVNVLDSHVGQMSAAKKQISAAQSGINSANSNVGSAVEIVSKMIKSHGKHAELHDNVKLVSSVDGVINSALADEENAESAISSANVVFQQTSSTASNIITKAGDEAQKINTVVKGMDSNALASVATKFHSNADQLLSASHAISSTAEIAVSAGQKAIRARDIIVSAAGVIDEIANNRIILDAIAISSAVDNVNKVADSTRQNGSELNSIINDANQVANNVNHLAETIEGSYHNNLVVNVLSAANGALSAASDASELGSISEEVDAVVTKASTTVSDNFSVITQNAEDANSAAVAVTSESAEGRPSTASAYNDIYMDRSVAVSSASTEISMAISLVDSAEAVMSSAKTQVLEAVKIINSKSSVATEKASLARNYVPSADDQAPSSNSAKAISEVINSKLHVEPVSEMTGGSGAADFLNGKHPASFASREKQARYDQQFIDAKAGYDAVDIEYGAVRSLSGFSRAYQTGYLTRFNQLLHKHLLYVYLKIATTYLHSAVYFTPRNRIVKLVVKDLSAAFEFKVLAIAIDDNGLLRYLINGIGKNDNLKGYITTSHDLVENAYYQANDLKTKHRVRIVNDGGVLVYDNADLDGGVLRHIREDKVLVVEKVVASGDHTCLKIGSGQFITANKKFVQIIK